MTHREAIKTLQDIKHISFMDIYLDKNEKRFYMRMCEALDMAIKALEQQPCEDCISREAVDEYITNLLSGYLYDEERTRLEDLSAFIWELPSVQPCEDCISRQAVHEMLENIPINESDKWFNWLQKACLRLAELPSVTPQPKIGHWINLENTKYKGQVLPFWSRYGCSKCGGHGEGTFNYCPNCGAKMAESEE